MKHGGKRIGAGRPKGSPNKNQAFLREYAKKIALGEGLDSPLDMMLETMRYLRAKAIEHEHANTVLIAGEGADVKAYTSIQLRLMAVEVAARAAPFVHPRLTAVEANVTSRIGLYEQSLLELADEADGSHTQVADQRS